MTKHLVSVRPLFYQIHTIVATILVTYLMSRLQRAFGCILSAILVHVRPEIIPEVGVVFSPERFIVFIKLAISAIPLRMRDSSAFIQYDYMTASTLRFEHL